MPPCPKEIQRTTYAAIRAERNTYAATRAESTQIKNMTGKFPLFKELFEYTLTGHFIRYTCPTAH